MIYVMSDIHGCFEEYQEMLEKINFNKHDTLYVIGDILDRGKHPLDIIQDMMLRPNIIALLGNHDLMAYYILNHLNMEITHKNVDNHLSEQFMKLYLSWIEDGGSTTLHQFKQLSSHQRKAILNYIQDFSLYEEITVNDQQYVLTHAGIDHFQENKPLSDYDITDFLFHRSDYGHIYYQDKWLVTGHTPTILIREDKQPLIYKKNHHIAIDCGCVFGKQLACYCLDNQKEYYVKRKTSR